jgi:HTH-type transcriptional regulator, cell division transcriptional repressor
MKIYLQNGKKNLIGRRLKDARLRAKPAVSQQELAARMSTMGISVDRTTISKIEAGSRLVTDYELLAFSKALGVPIEWLFAGVISDF